MDNFLFSGVASAENGKHEEITSRLKESWAREILDGQYHRVESRMFRDQRIFEGRKDEFAESTKSARPNGRATKSRNYSLPSRRNECKRGRVYSKYRTPRMPQNVFVLHVFLLFFFVLPDYRQKISYPTNLQMQICNVNEATHHWKAKALFRGICEARAAKIRFVPREADFNIDLRNPSEGK